MATSRGVRGVGNQTILLVDDDRVSSELRSAILVLNGYDVDLAFSPEEALAKVNLRDFDVCVLDYDMPQMKGTQLALVLRERGFFMPLIMLSGRLDAPTTEPGFESFSAFICKGQNTEDFLSALAMLTSASGAGDATCKCEEHEYGQGPAAAVE